MTKGVTWLMLSTACTGFALNISVFRKFSKKKKGKKTNADKLITSLACADIIFCLGVIVNSVILLSECSYYRKPLLIYWNISQGTSFSGSLLHIIAISIDRLVAVIHPIQYKNRSDPCKIHLGILAIWVLSLIVASTQFYLSLVVIDIIVCAMIVIASLEAIVIYSIIARYLFKRTKALAMDKKQMKKRLKSCKKSICLCALLTIAFFTCNLPFVVFNICVDFGAGKFTKEAIHALYYLLTINCVVDPIIYNFASKLLKFLSKKLIKKKESSRKTETQTLVSF